ncbi:FAD-dependent oxidoreductase [Quadrisphaera sp. RL12-1S]|nr:FAD-dependent oxidoreductase [Quadrisphaera sp. RL12-1S]
MLVVGGGTAGLVAAKTAARFGARVVLVERHRTGGDCLWTGCVPSKSLVAAAARAAEVDRHEHLGVAGAAAEVDLPRLAQHWRSAIETIEPQDSPDSIRETGAQVMAGRAVFTGERTASVDGRALTFRQALIATGSAPTVPDLPGLASAGALTSEDLWSHLEAMPKLPRRLVVLGGGPIGCELGQALARLGVQVTLLHSGEHLLAREDPDASAVVRAALERDGVHVRTQTRASAVEPSGDGSGGVVLDDGTRLPYDRLLVALGRSARTAGLGLQHAAVDLDERGHVRVDGHLRTSNPRVWAAGDVTGHPPFTHLAGVHGSLAATNAVLGLRRRTDGIVPRVTFTDPEVAAVGVPSGPHLPEGLRTVTVEHAHLDRAVTEDRREGFTRLVLDRRSRIVGATIVGPRAGESLGEVVLALSQGLRTRDLAAATHAYPTFSDGVWNAAVSDVRQSLGEGPLARATRLLLAARRRWLDSPLAG